MPTTADGLAARAHESALAGFLETRRSRRDAVAASILSRRREMIGKGKKAAWGTDRNAIVPSSGIPLRIKRRRAWNRVDRLAIRRNVIPFLYDNRLNMLVRRKWL